MKIRNSFYYETNKGRRDNNEDSLCAAQINENLLILGIADGMGGTVAGETASKIAIDTLINTFSNIDLQYDSAFLKNLLKDTYKKIQEEISKETVNNPSLSGMGTTLNAALIINGDKLIYSNIGDSRLYILNRGNLHQLSKDHSYIQEYRDKNKGEVPSEILKNYSNFITRSLDGGKDVPDIYPSDKDYSKLRKNSILIICSDGLILNQPGESQIIKSQIVDQSNLAGATSSLIKNALNRGSSDNISVVLYEYGHHRRSSAVSLFWQNISKKILPKNHRSGSIAQKTRKRARLLQRVIGTLILALTCILVALYFKTLENSTSTSLKVIPKVIESPITAQSGKPEGKSSKPTTIRTEIRPVPKWEFQLLMQGNDGQGNHYTFIINGKSFINQKYSFKVTKGNNFHQGENSVIIKYKTDVLIPNAKVTLNQPN